MKYFIDKVNTWSAANRKCKEVQAFVTEFRQTLIPDDAAVEALVEEIRQKVEELNEAYPRTKRLKVRKEGNFVCCDNEEPKVDDQHVFTFHIEKVRHTYKTLEQADRDPRAAGYEAIEQALAVQCGGKLKEKFSGLVISLVELIQDLFEEDIYETEELENAVVREFIKELYCSPFENIGGGLLIITPNRVDRDDKRGGCINYKPGDEDCMAGSLAALFLKEKSLYQKVQSLLAKKGGEQ